MKKQSIKYTFKDGTPMNRQQKRKYLQEKAREDRAKRKEARQ